MSILTIQHIVALGENKKLKLKNMPYAFAESLKQAIHLCLIKQDFKIADILKNLSNLNEGGLQNFFKKDINEITGLLDVLKDIFLMLDTDISFQQKIKEALLGSILIEFEIEHTAGGKEIETNQTESSFDLEKMMEKGLTGHYYNIVVYILKTYYLPFIPTLIMKSKLQ